MQRRITNTLRGAAVFASLGLLATGCSAPGGGQAEPVEEASLTYMADDGTCEASPIDGIDWEAAHEFVAPFDEPAIDVLATEPLAEPISPDTTFAFLNNGTPIAGLFREGLEQAASAAGVEFINIDTGTDAQSINAAMNSVVELAPDVLLDQSVDAMFFQDQLEQLKDNGTVIVYGGQLNAEEFGLVDSLGGAGSVQVNSEVLSASAIDLTCGTATEFVFYSVPELPSATLQTEAVESSLAELCAECTLRVVDISILDPSPADKIISDLQAHPETQFFISMADQFQIGLHDKAELSGVENARGIGQSSLPTNFQQIADGQQVAGYAVDFGLFMWLQIDEGLRRVQGMDVPYLGDWEKVATTISHSITIRNADQYLGGYVAYPGMEDEFKKMWGK
jgi:ABC-type sugar transport system substrate-binding protein